MKALEFSQIFINYSCRINLPINIKKIDTHTLMNIFNKNKQLFSNQWVHPNIFIELKNKKLIDSMYSMKVYKRKIKYYIKIDKQSFEIRFYIFFWIRWYDYIKKITDTSEYKKYILKYIISDKGFINLNIEKTTSSTIINHKSRRFRLDGIFNFPKINICIEIMEEHHNIKDETDLARPLKDVMTEATFKDDNKMFLMINIWEYKMKNKKYVKKVNDFIIEKIYLAHITEKEFVIRELMKTFNDRYIAKSIYMSHKKKDKPVIHFLKFFNTIIEDISDVNKLFKLFIEYNIVDEESDDDLSGLESDNIVDEEITEIKSLSSNKIEDCKINFSGFQDCFGIIIYNNDFDISIRKKCKATRDDILNKLINSYKTIFKKQREFLIHGSKIDSNKNYFKI
tara:strand:+ start:8318 stop:9505 length:1188 start_codon:yes stop_codon:yes gene_type:complete